MSVKVAINGFGRIGRLAFRQMFGAEGFEIVAINDLTSPKMLAHLLKYDSTQGNYAAQGHVVEAGEDNIVVDGKKITIYAKANAAELPWGELGVDVVLECTGFYTSKAKAQAHIDAGAKKVVISAPAGNDLPTIVYNVNHNTLTKNDHIISAASCTTNCLAPMAKALNDAWKIQSGIMCTIHAYTGDQMILDGPQRKGDLRRSRAGAVNIVPNSTGAAKAIGLVIPELNGKLIGAAQRVPTPTGSTTILNAVVEGNPTKEEINAQMKSEATESFGYNEDEIVSSDIVGMRFGSLFDATQTWSSTWATAPARFRSFPGTTTRTPTSPRCAVPSSTSPPCCNRISAIPLHRRTLSFGCGGLFFFPHLPTSPERFSRCSHSQNGVQLLNAKLRRLTFVSRRGQPRYAEYQSECTKANSYHPPWLPPGGSWQT